MKTTLTTTILILFTQFCLAQDFWMQLNLPGDTTLNALAGNSEGSVFAATRKGVYTSLDNGLNWTNTGITNSAYRIFVDKEDRIFAAIYPNIHYSTNNGDSWSEIICPPVGIVTFHFNNNTIVFGNWGSIYKSADFGDTWTQTLEISNAKEVASIIETTDGTMFAGITAWSVPGGGVYLSMDNGDTWEYVGLWNHYIRSLATNSQGTLFAGSIGEGVGIYSSDDNGETWTGLKNDVFVTSIVVTPEDVIYIGCSNEHGTQGGVFRSFDDGETWEMINSGIEGYWQQCIYGLSLAPDGYLYAYGHYLFRTGEPVFSVVYTISASANPIEGGSVNGTGEYNHGQTATLTATPNEGYAFVNWTDTLGVVLSTDTVYNFTVASSIELVANFELESTTSNPQNAIELKFYPNPATGQATLSIPNVSSYKNPTLHIINLYGQTVKTMPINGKQTLIDLTDLPAGSYLYRFTDGSELLKTGKFVIHK